MLNTGELQKVLETTLPDQFFSDDVDDVEDFKAPCYQVNINKERKAFVFLIDQKELFSYPYEGFDLTYDTVMETIKKALAMVKNKDVSGLKEFLESRKDA